MFNFLKCLLFGHKPYRPQALNEKDVMTIHDALGFPLVHINFCERCKVVFGEFD